MDYVPFIKEAIQQAPGAALVVLVVVLFLRHMSRREDRFTATMTQWQSQMAQLHERSIAVIDRNTETFGRVVSVLDEVADELRESRKR